MKILIILILSVALLTGDDPPKKNHKKDSVLVQLNRSYDKLLEQLNASDTIRPDTLKAGALK